MRTSGGRSGWLTLKTTGTRIQSLSSRTCSRPPVLPRGLGRHGCVARGAHAMHMYTAGVRTARAGGQRGQRTRRGVSFTSAGSAATAATAASLRAAAVDGAVAASPDSGPRARPRGAPALSGARCSGGERGWPVKRGQRSAARAACSGEGAGGEVALGDLQRAAVRPNYAERKGIVSAGLYGRNTKIRAMV